MEERQKGITEIGKETEERLSGIVHTSEAPTGELTEPKAQATEWFCYPSTPTPLYRPEGCHPRKRRNGGNKSYPSAKK